MKIIPKGLGSKNTKKILSINKEMPTTSTFAKHWKSGRFSNLKWPDKIQVQITTLDSLIKKFGNPQYIKIDVEGYDLNVLKTIDLDKIHVQTIKIEHKHLDDNLIVEYLEQFNYIVWTEKNDIYAIK